MGLKFPLNNIVSITNVYIRSQVFLDLRKIVRQYSHVCCNPKVDNF